MINKWYIFFLAVMLASCDNSQLINQSGIKLEVKDNFLITDVFQTDAGYSCFGSVNNSDTSALIQYDNNLKIIKVIDPHDYGIKGRLKLYHKRNGGWVGASFDKNEQEIGVYVLDEDFNIIHRRNESVLSDMNVDIYQVKELKNGDILVARDSSRATGQPLVKRYKSNLEEVYSYSNFQEADTSPDVKNTFYSFLTYELPDESLFYCYAFEANGTTRIDKPDGGFLIRFIQIKQFHSGRLDSQGDLLLENKEVLEDLSHAEGVGLSFTGQNFIWNAIVDDEHIQTYAVVDPESGKIQSWNSFSTSWKNHQISRRAEKNETRMTK